MNLFLHQGELDIGQARVVWPGVDGSGSAMIVAMRQSGRAWITKS